MDAESILAENISQKRFSACLDSSDVTMASESVPFSCNIYPVMTKAQDTNFHSCACPNSAKTCTANAAAVSRSWIANTPQSATVSLADYLVYKTPESGTGSLVLMADLGTVCGDTGSSYVLCEGKLRTVL